MQTVISDLKSRPTPDSKQSGLLYITVWRWHFYAGLFCIPFVLWLSCTGLIYLFKPQIDQAIDRPYDRLSIQGPLKLPSEQVAAALKSVPGSVFTAYEMPPNEHAAARVLVGQQAETIRIYVHPQSLQILHTINENDRLTREISHLHGELMLGDTGSRIVELAASWAIVMILTGLFLWFGKGKLSLAGMAYPRFHLKERPFWKDLHAVVGFWVAGFTLFMLISGLPWTSSWGGMLKSIRQWSSPTPIHQDWSTGSRSEAMAAMQMHQAMQQGGMSGMPMAGMSEHADHGGHHRGARGTLLSPAQYAALDRIIAQTPALNLPPPVQVHPPIPSRHQPWNVTSETQNRPLRQKVIYSDTGDWQKTETFGSKPLLDRLIGYGVAIHEGQLFGWLNLALGVFTALGLILVITSGLIMWLKRRPTKRLGAPTAVLQPRLAISLKALIVIMGVLLPMFGISLLIVLLLDRFVLSRIPPVARFLGLQSSVHMA